MTKEFRYFSYLKLDSSVVTSCTKTDGKWKVVIFWADMAGIINFAAVPSMQQVQWYYEAPENIPQQGNCYDIPGDYFQAVHNFIMDIKTQNTFSTQRK